MKLDNQYEKLMQDILDNGEAKEDRTGTGTRSVFGRTLRYDVGEHFPLITTKRIHFKSVALELLWMLKGDTNIKALNEDGVTIWDEWADEEGELGPVYGAQWRSWRTNLDETIDQVSEVIESLKNNPSSRRHVVSAWNVGELEEMALAPCHILYQFNVRGDKLDIQVYQRSADIFLGVPFNIASYALLLTLMAEQTGYTPGDLIWVGGDVHLYENHIEQAKLQLSRQVIHFPILEVKKNVPSLFDYSFEDLTVRNYKPHAGIKATVAV